MPTLRPALEEHRGLLVARVFYPVYLQRFDIAREGRHTLLARLDAPPDLDDPDRMGARAHAPVLARASGRLLA